MVPPPGSGEEVEEVLLDSPVMQADEITITVIIKTMSSEVPFLILFTSNCWAAVSKTFREKIER